MDKLPQEETFPDPTPSTPALPSTSSSSTQPVTTPTTASASKPLTNEKPPAVSEEKTPLASEEKLPAETTPLIPSTGFTPVLFGEKPGPIPDIHSRFGFQAFFNDISDVQNGSVPISVLIAAVIGVFCGVAAFFYYKVLEFFLEYLWETLPEQIAEALPFWPNCFHWLWIPIMGMSMAILVGVAQKVLGYPGDLPYTVKCVHEDAYVPLSHAPSMVVTSQVSILGGGSLGPEAPLVAICASVAGWVSITLFNQKYKNIVRKHTLCGMACALAAFFGVPLGGSLFALEINHRLGYEYVEHALEAILSGTICLVVFRSMAGLPIGPIYFFTDNLLKDSSAGLVCVGAILGLVGALLGVIFAHGHWFVVKKLSQFNVSPDPLKSAIVGGAVVCLLGVLIPQTFFWGEFEMQTIGALEPASKLPHVWPTAGLMNFEITGASSAMLVGMAKLVAISFTVAGGYRGGFIFPFFAAGAAFGRAIWYIFPSIPPVVAVLSVACGINVTITRTALATPLILCGLAGEVNATPPVLAASLVAAFVTYYMVSFMICFFLFKFSFVTNMQKLVFLT